MTPSTPDPESPAPAASLPPPDALARLVHDIGPLSADVISVTEDSPHAWTVTFHDENQVMLTWLDGPPRLELLSWITALDTDLPRDALELVLSFNLLSSQTGGARMGLNIGDRSLFLLRDLPVDGLDLPHLLDAMRSLASASEEWRHGLSALGPTPRDEHESLTSSLS